MERKLPQGRFGGETVTSREIAGLLLIENSYPPGLKLPRNHHESAYFCLVRQGAFSEKSCNNIRACRPLTLIFHPPLESHADHFGNEGGRCFNIQLSYQWLKRGGDRLAAFENPVYYKGGILVQLALRLYHESYWIDEVSALVVEGLVLEIMGETTRSHVHRHNGDKAPRWLKQARDLLHTHFASPLSLISIAEAVGVHPTLLARVFRRNFRCTVGEYLRHLRIEFARREIVTSATPLAQIASSAGFSDQSHFSKTFKRLTGHTPAEFRRISPAR